jgi:beta-lactamase regulating signal transducer with metallopeptidase domain
MMLHMDELARFAAEGIVNSLLGGITIAVITWAVARLIHRQGSRTRFVVWLLGLIAIALLPWAGSVSTSSGLTDRAPAAGALTLPDSFAFYLFVVWIVGVAFGLARLAVSLFRLRSLRSTCTLVDVTQLDPSLRSVLEDACSDRPVTLCISDSVRVPAALGYFRPMVVFPAWALEEIPVAELNAILLHELAHLRRWDDWTNLAQKIVKAVFFFHPAVWFIESHLSLEREMACDDAVLAANFSPRAYAESLVGLAERSFVRHGIQLAQAAVGHVQQLKVRLAEILRKDRSEQGSSLVRKPAIALMALAVMVSTYSLSRAPRLVAFSSPSASSTTSAAASRSSLHPSSLLEVSRLQPVNLTYAVHAAPPVATVRKTENKRPRSAHQPLLTPRVDLTQRVASHQATGDDIAPPMMVLSSFSHELEPAPVLVIFQGEQFGVNGPVLWRVTVFHLTPAQQRMISGGVPKKI